MVRQIVDETSSAPDSRISGIHSGVPPPYDPEPDYRRPALELTDVQRRRLRERLCFLYGGGPADLWLPELERILKVHDAHAPPERLNWERTIKQAERFTERDLVLITYGDMLHSTARSPLAGLGRFMDSRPLIRLVFSTVHILPFFPYSSDHGFSVVDFRRVDPRLGSWHDIERIGRSYRLMFDGVLNHISSRSRAFQEMLNGHPDFKDLAVVFRSPDELTADQRRILVRPRTSDILTRYESIQGPVWVWTTFSPDQIDLNYKNPKVLMGALDTLLLYVRKGAGIIRLDAVTYLWDEPGTPGANLAQSHEIIKLCRDVLDLVAPSVILLTETNVPHRNNVSYFGDGSDEAQMVYNFALPPLVLHTFYQGDASKLTEWAAGLEYPSPTTTFFNILDTHDGIGLPGVKDILSEEEIGQMLKRAVDHGAFISFRSKGGDACEPYEINSTWFGALNPMTPHEPLEFQVRRFVASRSIAFSLRGVPGIYFHGLIGTGNDPSVVQATEQNREINRMLIDEDALIAAAQDPESKVSLIIRQLGPLLVARINHPAFHPNAAQQILRLSEKIFAVWRVSPGGSRSVLALTNVTGDACRLLCEPASLPVSAPVWRDTLTGQEYICQEGTLEIRLSAYGVSWLEPGSA
jgi:sucrose phosphorylase